MKSDAIEFQNRYTGLREVETIYGDSYLRWAYDNVLGRASLHLLAKRKLFSAWYGTRMDRPKSAGLIEPFIERYRIDMNQYARSADEFESFNAFFHRELKEGARPLDSNPATVCFPADGRHLGIQNIDSGRTFYVKGQRFNLASFLGNDELAHDFAEGSMVISRLCPVDYHRFHAPAAGTLRYGEITPGPLFSVNPVALKRNLGYLWQNKRMIATIASEEVGKVGFALVGATCVGRIHMARSSGSIVEKGEELGYFAFGGSCVVTIFQKDRIELDADLTSSTRETTELYAHVRDRMGEATESGSPQSRDPSTT